MCLRSIAKSVGPYHIGLLAAADNRSKRPPTRCPNARWGDRPRRPQATCDCAHHPQVLRRRVRLPPTSVSMRAGDGGRSPTALLGRAIGRSSGCPLPAGRGELAPSSSRTAQEVPFGRLLGAAARQRQHSASKAARPQWNPPFCDGRHGGLRLCVPTSQCGPLGGPIGQNTAMERFIRRENIKRFRKLLLEAKDDAERRRLQKLLIDGRPRRPRPRPHRACPMFPRDACPL